MTNNGVETVETLHHRRPAAYWLIVKNQTEPVEILTLDLEDQEKALPVFCFAEEAEMFLSLETLESGWRLKETTASELASVLRGPCASVGLVALDPLPELVSFKLVGLISERRGSFMGRLIKSAKSREADFLAT